MLERQSKRGEPDLRIESFEIFERYAEKGRRVPRQRCLMERSRFEVARKLPQMKRLRVMVR